jgi:hypothetical protein
MAAGAQGIIVRPVAEVVAWGRKACAVRPSRQGRVGEPSALISQWRRGESFPRPQRARTRCAAV